jgi:hypothetical protein
MICRLAGSVRLAVVVLLLLTAQPGRFVLCLAADHAELEDAFALCCGDAGAVSSGRPQGALLPASAFLTDCGDCTDVPLVSVWPPEAVQKTVNLQAPPALLPALSEQAPIFSASPALDRTGCASARFFEPCPIPLRC